MYFILYFIREAVNLPMPFLILLSSLPLTEKTVKVIFLLGTDIQADTKDKINCRL